MGLQSGMGSSLSSGVKSPPVMLMRAFCSEEYLRTWKMDFQYGFASLVTGQQVGYAGCVRVHSATRIDAEVSLAMTACILDSVAKAWFDDGERHAGMCLEFRIKIG